MRALRAVLGSLAAAPVTMVLALLMLLSPVGSDVTQASAVTPVTSAFTAPSQQQGPTDAAEMEAFLDELMSSQMEEQHIAGAAIAVVQDGEVLFQKGYGYADLENDIPVDPDETVFRIGSVTKLFTWTAVMQLVERGELDLDADVNAYLDFSIPDTYPEPITLEHLLTHTAGFEDRFFEYVFLDADDMVPEREWLVSHMPARVRPPGDAAAYSNYGTALAGYIIARVSGQPYAQFIQENILDVLGMTHTTAWAPTPPDLRPRVSRGYTVVDGALEPFPDYLGQPATVPAGSMQASAADLARFMIAHLQGGVYRDVEAGESRILSEATAQQMHSTLFTHDPRLLGTTYGLFDFTDNGQRTIGHSGESFPHNCLLLLLPDRNLGVFVVYNSEGGADLVLQHLGFQRAFFDHYYPSPPVEPVQPPAGFAERAGRFEGSYRLSRSSYTTFEKVAGLLSPAAAISDPGDGTLLLATPWGDWRLIEVEPLYFRMVDDAFGFTFREDDRGRITHMFTDLTPMYAFEKLAWYETPGFGMALLGACALLFLSMIPVASVRALHIRRQRAAGRPVPRGARMALWTLAAICVLNLLFLIGTAVWGNPIPLFGVSTIYRIVLGLGVLAAVLTVGALAYTVLAWKEGYWSTATRVHYTLVTLAAVAFVWFLNFWNLLGWRF